LPSTGAEAELIDLHMRRSSSPGTASATGSKPMMGTSSIRSDRWSNRAGQPLARTAT